MSIDPYSTEPLYIQLATILREKIRAGEWKQLDRLPSEQSLVQEYGISRDTVRKVVALLRDEGLVFTLGQRGTFVGPRP